MEGISTLGEMKGRYFMKFRKTAALLAAMSLLIGGIPVGFGSPARVEAAAGDTNIALGTTIEVSGSENAASWPASAMADGIKDTDASRWSSAPMSTTTIPTQPFTAQWVIMDLGSTSSQISGIDISFYKKVWSTEYVIQTCDTKSTTDSDWQTLYTKSQPAGATLNLVNTFDTPSTAKRFLRFKFSAINTAAAWNCLSIREIEVTGQKTGAIQTTATEQLSRITTLPTLTLTSTDVLFPEVAEGYTASLRGSDLEPVISNEGKVTSHNIGARNVDVIVQVENDSDPSDKAEKNMVITVPDKTSLYPQIYRSAGTPNQKPEVIPTLQEWYGYEGDFHYTQDTRIILNDAAGLTLTDIGQSMKKDLLEITGFEPAVVTGTSADVRPNDIYIESQEADTYETGDNGYYMVTDETGLKIYSSTHTGCFYGTITVEQILFQDRESLTIPCGVIRDYPKFQVRGLMLDVARAPFRYQAIKDIAKTMSWYKMSEFHLHINDNFFRPTDSASLSAWQGVEAMFRLESSTFKSLGTDIHTEAKYDYYNNVYKNPQYTKEQWKELQALGAQMGVQVLTEIDAPGHSAAFTKYSYYNPDDISWLGTDKSIQCSRNWEQLSLTGDSGARAKQFITALMEEYTNPADPTFTNDSVHIGADEYWNATAEEKTAMASYIRDMHDLLTKNGKTMRMWGHIEPYFGNLPEAERKALNDIVLDVWCSQGEGGDNVTKRLAEGFQIVNVDNHNLYNNPLRNKRDTVNAEHLYESWSPYTMSGGVAVKKGEPGLLGVKTAVWADVNRKGSTEKDFSDRITRAIAVISEKTWGAQNENSMEAYETFTFRSQRLKEGPGTGLGMNIESRSSLVADYDFANVAAADHETEPSTLFDASGNNYNATVNGGSLVKEDGVTYLKFDSDTSVTTPLETLSYPYTVSFDLKVKAEDAAKNTPESSLFSGYDGRLQIAAEDGAMYLNRGIFEQSLHYQVPQDQKVSVTVVGTYQVTKIYINKKLFRVMYRQNEAETDESQDNLSTTFCFPLKTIGTGFNGYLANIKAYNKALSPEVISGAETGEYVNIAQNKGAAGDAQRKGQGSQDVVDKKLHVAWKAVDGDGRNVAPGTYTGATTDPHSQWMGFYDGTDSLTLDLGKVYPLSKAVIQWNAPGYASSFKIQTSNDGKTWTDSITVTGNTSDLSRLQFEPGTSARYVKMQGVARNGANGYSIQEFEVYEAVDKTQLRTAVVEAEELLGENEIQFGMVPEGYEDLFETAVFAKALLNSPVAEGAEVAAALSGLTRAIADAEEIVPDPDLTDIQRFISRIYNKILDREPDTDGMTYYNDLLVNNSLTGAQIGYNFIFSEEFTDRSLSNGDYVEVLYNTFMDRSSDADGKAYWVNFLDNGVSREFVFKGFVESSEYTGICSETGITRGTVALDSYRDKNPQLTMFISRMYLEALGRAPEIPGLEYYAEKLILGEVSPVQVSQNFIISPEFESRNLSDSEFIKVLYRTFMGREFDEGGLQYHLNRLTNHTSREDILRGFAFSPEFENIRKGFGL